MALVDQTPSVFATLDLGQARKLPIAEKLRVFHTLAYPASTWWYHRVIGVGKERGLADDQRLAFIKHLTEEDLFYFARVVLRKDRLRERPNREMAERVMSRHWHGRQERKLVVEPREVYKTTLATMAFAIWSLVKNRDISVLIYSETDKQAKEIYLTCKEEFEMNELLQRIWGKFSSDRWNETSLYVAGRTVTRRDPSLTHAGLDTSLNGVHPDLALCDDLCSEENTQSSVQRDKAYDKYRLLTPLVQKDGLIQVVGTRWCPDDLVDRILQNERDDYSEISIKGAEDKDEAGHLYGEDIGLTQEVLDKKRRLFGFYRYSANYLNNPIPDAEQALQEKWLQFYDTPMPTTIDAAGEERPIPLRIFMALDASWADKDSKSGKDPSAIWVAGIDHNAHWWLLEHINRRIAPEEVVSEVLRLADKWQPEDIASEHVGTQKGINQFLETEMQRRGKWHRMNYIKHQARSKRNRIMGLAPAFEAGTIHLRPTMTDFVDQYRTFSPHYDLGHDDLLDALEMLVTAFGGQAAINQDQEAQEREFEEAHAYFDPITGRS
jgi:predicted phage terminase large subunit-like protein